MSQAVDIHTALRSYTAWAAPLLFLEDKASTLDLICKSASNSMSALP
jgi:hypothetical protein